MNRIIWIVIDSVGVGALPDAKAFGDEGVNTLGHIVKEFNDIKIPNMVKFGLGNIDGIDYIKNVDSPIGSLVDVMKYLKEKILLLDIGR